jgi:hypothetical protein
LFINKDENPSASPTPPYMLVKLTFVDQCVKDGVGVPYPNPLKHWVELQSKESSGKVNLKLMMHKG